METLKAKLSSRKFIAAFCGALFPPILAYIGQDIELGEALQLSAAVFVSYIFGQGYVDAAESKAIAAIGSDE